MKLKDYGIALLLIVLGIFSRWIPHPLHFTALGAVALWSTTLLPSRVWAFTLPIAVLFISDLWIGFHNQMVWVYGSFLLIAALSLWIEPRQSWGRTIAGALSSSLLFFMITNFGVWTTGEMYPMNAAGLMESYVAGIPFLKNQIAGDLFYSVVLGLCVRAVVARRSRALPSRVF